MIKEELLYELILEDEEDGVFANSIVNTPAIERDFVFFGKEINFQAVNDEKMLVAGPLLIPNKKILRLDGEGKNYYVFFKPETIEKIARKFMKNKFGDAVTIEHDKKVDGIHLVESWIIEQSAKDKSNIYGFTLPKGTWFGIYDVSGNKKVWQDIKDGKFHGFSIEGLFEHKVSNVKLSLMEKNVEDLNDTEAEVVLSYIKALIKKDKRYKKKERVEMESYSDYPQTVREAARIAREQNEKVGGKCMTLVGKKRSADLEAGRPVSRDTIARMVSYLSRAKSVYEENKGDRLSCAYIAYKGWGGETALVWAENKLKQIENLEAQPSVQSSYPGEGPYKKKKQKMAIEKPNVNVFGYHTRYFEMCPGAQSLFEHLVTMPVDEETIGMIRSAAGVADNVFRKEKEVIEAGVASQHDYEEVLYLVDDFKDIMAEIDEEVGMMHDVSFMDGHVEKVKGYL